ncbi:MAG TPA: phage holin family protein [Candidatus Limosilactobacillus faecipullorum]|nr:phage holin family protein [Candidatus Limosilactobacillus faecipullorum]
MRFLKEILINTVLFVALAGLFAQTGMFYLSSFGAAVLASLVLSMLNVLVKPILWILSLPINILTLGLFSFVLNGLMLELTSWFIGSQFFHFSSIWGAILVALIMSLFNTIISSHYQD